MRLFPVVGRVAHRPSRCFLDASLCAARRAPVFLSAHLVFELLFRRVFFVGARFVLFAVVLSCLRYFVVVDGGLCPLIDICFVS